MKFKEYAFKDLLINIVDNRGKTCPTAESGIPLIATNCIKNDALYPAHEKVRFVDDNTYDNWFRGHPKPGDIIFVCKGSPGRVCWTPDPVDFCIAQDMLAIRADETKIHPKYLFALLRSEETQNKILNMHVGTLIPHFKKGDFGNLYFDIPEDMEYQKQVGEAYFEFCNKIELNRQTNQMLEEMAQAVFKSWFVDFEPTRAKIAAKENGQDPESAAMAAIAGKTIAQLETLPPEQLKTLKFTATLFPDTLVNSGLGEIPQGWEAKPLYETAEYVNGGAFKAIDFCDPKEGLPIIKIAELKQGIYDGTKYTLKDVKQRHFITNDDVLYSWSGSPETSLEVFKWFGGDGWLNQHIFKLNFSSDAQKYFTYYLLQHMKPVLIATAQDKQTTGLGHVTVADMKRLLVPYPDQNTFEKFKDVISPLYDQCSILEKEIMSLSETRDTLLPKLLNGEIEVNHEVAA